MVSSDLLVSTERKETEVCLDLRAWQEGRVILVSVVLLVPSALLVLLVFLELKDRKAPRDQLGLRDRRETLD